MADSTRGCKYLQIGAVSLLARPRTAGTCDHVTPHLSALDHVQPCDVPKSIRYGFSVTFRDVATSTSFPRRKPKLGLRSDSLGEALCLC